MSYVKKHRVSSVLDAIIEQRGDLARVRRLVGPSTFVPPRRKPSTAARIYFVNARKVILAHLIAKFIEAPVGGC